ncbi:4-hydroxy-3-methylbut-2-enyl diphosphate reductase [Candidatus Pacearchaeota archaeon]|nr:4-hydroxy-3-methylbut-2-enyl diphosphate reductase [Candidatus Pacearchaeota archaeon]
MRAAGFGSFEKSIDKMTELERIILAEPRGFCAGVNVAIDTVVRLSKDYLGEPLYMVHEVVHSKHVVKDLNDRYGVVNVGDISKVPDGARVVFSAHGTHPGVLEEAKRRGLKINNAVCDLVTVVHNQVKKYAERGVDIVLIGHEKHQEVIATMGQTHMYLVQNVDDVENLPINPNNNVAYVTQTTLSQDDTEEIEQALRERFPNLISTKDNLCYATTDRQGAIKAVIDRFDVGHFLVVGENNSSNSRSLVKTSKNKGVDAHLISTYKNIRLSWLEGSRNVGLTSGASVPEYLVDEVVDHLRKTYNCEVQIYVHKKEKVKFAPKVLV